MPPADSLREMVEREMHPHTWELADGVDRLLLLRDAVEVAVRMVEKERERIDGLAKTYDEVSSGYLERVRKHHRGGALVCKVCAPPKEPDHGA